LSAVTRTGLGHREESGTLRATATESTAILSKKEIPHSQPSTPRGPNCMQLIPSICVVDRADIHTLKVRFYL
jgi:hypothetical protein